MFMFSADPCGSLHFGRGRSGRVFAPFSPPLPATLPPSFYDAERKLASGRPFKAMLAGSMPVGVTTNEVL